jgi:glycerate-2-kinase
MYIDLMRTEVLDIYKSAVTAVLPGNLLNALISREGNMISLGDHVFDRDAIRHFYVVAAGKAAAAMGDTLEQLLGDAISEGIIITKYGHGLPMEFMTCIESGHPVPDKNGIKAGEAVLNLLQHAGEKDLVLVLLSGGASSLVADVVPGVSLEELQELSGLLLKCGANIREMNTVRKHLSRLKGGQFTRIAYPATVVCFALSDVPGDEADVIASGPTVPDPSTFGDVWSILEKYALVDQLGPATRDWLEKGLRGEVPETPKPGDPLFGKSIFSIIGNNHTALLTAASKALEISYTVLLDDRSIQGESRDVAVQLAQKIEEYTGERPACFLAGGETTVTVKGNGKGGRNQEFALALLNYWQSTGKNPDEVPTVLCAATDGNDGPTDAAGAVVDGTLLKWVYDNKVDTTAWLAKNDSYTFFLQTDAQLFTGPTYTNVMDLVIVLMA